MNPGGLKLKKGHLSDYMDHFDAAEVDLLWQGVKINK